MAHRAPVSGRRDAAEQRDLTRREWLRIGGGTAAALALTACGAPGAGPARSRLARPHARGPFIAPLVSGERVVRTTAGLRPYRPSGFVVRGARLGEKLLVHNYGHGGGGITLSWGSASLALTETRGVTARSAAVLGCGAVGLATARLLQDRGWDVTIYAKDLPPHTTSNVAGGLWGPTSVFAPDRLTSTFETRFARAARVSHHAFQNLVGAGYGVRWVEQYYLGDQPLPVPYYIRTLPDLYPGATDLQPEEHPFPVVHVRRIVTMLIEPGVYLRRLMADFRMAGGDVIVRELREPAEVAALPQPVVFNCTGLGAGALFGDDELTPVKGQLAFLPPDPAVDFATIGGGQGSLYMFPRRDGILLGGTFERGESSTVPDPAETDRIVQEHARLFGAMGDGSGG